MASNSTLRSLANLISSSVDIIEERVQVPDLDLACHEGEVPDKGFSDPAVVDAISCIVAATAQLVATIRPAHLTLISTAMMIHVPSALRTATDLHVAEILRDAGPQGLHIRKIAALCCTSPGKLARILRLLATEHIFKEVTPDVFANNRISSLLDTGKSVDKLIESAQYKWDGGVGIAAFVSYTGGHTLKFTSYLAETMQDPSFAHSEDHIKAPFNYTSKTDLPFWQWLDLPENEEERRKFGLAMTCAPKHSMLDGFEWGQLPQNGVVVDVGGGVGMATLPVAKVFPDLKIIIQDRPKFVADARKLWKEELPGAVSSGHVSFQVHDFFEPQPIKAADVYLMRWIMHDWNDSMCISILKHLRDAAGPGTKLLIVDALMSYACQDSFACGIPGATKPLPPKPLLENFGHARVGEYLFDLQMWVTVNGQERTIRQFSDILQIAGWKIEEVKSAAATQAHIIAIPSTV
ncbi:S-adenosyl-L-methionine-dependent methyltransferase [Desarmillaria tabescens]|uniref:S-adenosyl-L-methionine-dependent methyltransferase n=1 Tax=Armillaria tabescens TaxID=1929756 RepID=A0AA39JXC0_ARMTA|nr:S-adenosyl-L-methionine-dependent methyltransferase [Desarmillaria tabescens]KAK0450342.1 S-adenosyl-L-methionine-dependent methyltransferase [Desarmillaria tabescens]